MTPRFACAVQSCGWSKAAFYENFIETAGEVAPELDDLKPEQDDDGRSLVLRSSPTGGSNDLKRLYLLGIASARRTVDITTPYFVTDESSEWSLRGCGQPRGQDPHSRRRRQHRRDAGQVRLARGLRAAARDGDRDLRVSADDDAHEDDRRGRRVEHVRIGELRQPIAGAERRAERRRVRSRSGARLLEDFEQDLRVVDASSSRAGGSARSSRRAREHVLVIFRGNILIC